MAKILLFLAKGFETMEASVFIELIATVCVAALALALANELNNE